MILNSGKGHKLNTPLYALQSRQISATPRQLSGLNLSLNMDIQ